jgi:hypothetical protein
VLVFLGACLDERTAGTEVGNPEITVVARIEMVNSNDTMRMDDFNLKMVSADFITLSGDSGKLWNTDTGTMFDMADNGVISSLPSMKISSEPWKRCELNLALPTGDSAVTDSSDTSLASGHNWARWHVNGKDRNKYYLFYLPNNYRLRLVFGPWSMRPWHSGDTVFVTMTFNTSDFTDALPTGEWIKHLENDTGDYYVLSPHENEPAHAALLAAFPKCFSADSIAMGASAKVSAGFGAGFRANSQVTPK